MRARKRGIEDKKICLFSVQWLRTTAWKLSYLSNFREDCWTRHEASCWPGRILGKVLQIVTKWLLIHLLIFSIEPINKPFWYDLNICSFADKQFYCPPSWTRRRENPIKYTFAELYTSHATKDLRWSRGILTFGDTYRLPCFLQVNLIVQVRIPVFVTGNQSPERKNRPRDAGSSSRLQNTQIARHANFYMFIVSRVSHHPSPPVPCVLRLKWRWRLPKYHLDPYPHVGREDARTRELYCERAIRKCRVLPRGKPTTILR